MVRSNPNRLLVEGDDDKRVVPFLMDQFIQWGDTPADWPVFIESFNGIDEMLKPGVIEAEMKISGLKSLGVLVDADTDPRSCWVRIRERASSGFPDLPDDLPVDGLIREYDGLRFGVWLMPDNKSPGMMETFLRLCVPESGTPLWDKIRQHCREAKEQYSAPYKDVHEDKARIHAWLALQDPPGLSLHLAVLSKTLQPSSPHADSFVEWFCGLFGLERRAPS